MIFAESFVPFFPPSDCIESCNDVRSTRGTDLSSQVHSASEFFINSSAATPLSFASFSHAPSTSLTLFLVLSISLNRETYFRVIWPVYVYGPPVEKTCLGEGVRVGEGIWRVGVPGNGVEGSDGRDIQYDTSREDRNGGLIQGGMSFPIWMPHKMG